MKIDKENYEAWMLDYLEGKLSGKQLALFEQFLSEHPELREEAEGLEDMTLSPSDRFFEDKSLLKAKMLKQVIDEEELSTFEAAEGILPADKRDRLDKRMAGSPRLAEKLHQYKEAKLTADESIVFADKASLKRTEPAVAAKERILWPYMVAAAMMAGVVYFVVPKESGSGSSTDQKPIAALVKTPAKGFGSAQPPKKEQVKGEVKAPAVNEINSTPVQPNVAVAPKVTNIGARLKHEALTAPAKDFAQHTKKPAAQKEEAPIIKEPLYPQPTEAVTNQQFTMTTPKEIKPYKPEGKAVAKTNTNRNAAGGTPNPNFVRSTPAPAPKTEAIPVQYATAEEHEQKESKRKFSVTNRLLGRITGDRLKIEEKGSKKVGVKFETQLLGFSTTF